MKKDFLVEVTQSMTKEYIVSAKTEEEAIDIIFASENVNCNDDDAEFDTSAKVIRDATGEEKTLWITSRLN